MQGAILACTVWVVVLSHWNALRTLEPGKSALNKVQRWLFSFTWHYLVIFVCFCLLNSMIKWPLFALWMIIYSAIGRNWWYFDTFKVIWIIWHGIRRQNLVFSAFVKFRIIIWRLSRISTVSMIILRVFKWNFFWVFNRYWARKSSKWAWYVRWVHSPALSHPRLFNRKVILEHLNKIFFTFSSCCRISGRWGCEGGGTLQDALLGYAEKLAKDQHLVIALWGTQGGRILWTLIFCEKLTQLLSKGLF